MKKDKRTNNDLQNNTQKTKDQATQTPIRMGDELRYSRRVSSGICQVTLVTNPVISHQRGKDREVVTTSGTYLWSFVFQVFLLHFISNIYLHFYYRN